MSNETCRFLNFLLISVKTTPITYLLRQSVSVYQHGTLLFSISYAPAAARRSTLQETIL